MNQKDRAGRVHGKGGNRNHISSDTLSSLKARKKLLVATIRVFWYRPPPAQSKGKGIGARSCSGSFLFFHLFYFWFFPNIPKIKWTKSEEKRNFGVGGFCALPRAGLLPSPSPPIPNTWRSTCLRQSFPSLEPWNSDKTQASQASLWQRRALVYKCSCRMLPADKSTCHVCHSVSSCVHPCRSKFHRISYLRFLLILQNILSRHNFKKVHDAD